MRLSLRLLPTLLAFLVLAAPVFPADLKVLTAGAYKPMLADLAEALHTQTGHRLDVSNDTAGGVTARVNRGEDADLVILPLAALETLAAKGKIQAGSASPLAKVGIGVVVKEGMPVPNISTVEAFRVAVLASPSIAYIDPVAGGSSGIYLASLFERLGMAEALKRKSVLVPGGLTASRVSGGEAAMALQQISELRAVRGVTYVGPLPAEIQNYTLYAGGVAANAQNPEAARAVLRFLHGDAAVRALAARGLEKP